jgi:hypothetical protein
MASGEALVIALFIDKEERLWIDRAIAMPKFEWLFNNS